MPNPTIWRTDLNVTASAVANGSSFLAASPEGRYGLVFNAGPDVAHFVYDGAGGYAADISFSDPLDQVGFASSAFLENGFVVTGWAYDATATGSFDIYLQVRTASGQSYARLTEPLPANPSSSPNHETFPLVVPLANGSFALAWFDSSNSIYTAVYDLLGTSLSPFTQVGPVNGASLAYHAASRASVTPLDGGGYAIGYVDVSGEARLSISDTNANMVADEIDLFPGTSEEGIAGVAQLADGRIVAAAGKDGMAGLVVRFLSEAGAVLTPVIDIALTGVDADEDINPRITPLQDGRFMIVTSAASEGAADSDVWGVLLMADGTIDGTPFRVNDSASGSQSAPSIAVLADGRVIVSWTDDQTGSGDIWTKIYDPRETGLRGGASTFDDDWYGTSFSDTVFLGNGRDAFHGGGSADFIYGDAGSDTLYGEASDDRIDGGTGADVLIGGIGNDIYYVDNAGDDVQDALGEGVDTVRATLNYALGANEDKLYILGTAVSATGNGLSNFIYGNANANLIDGLAGADRLYGYQGNDTYTVDSTGDLVFETIAGVAGGIDTVVSSANHTLSNNVENLTLAGANINGTGNPAANAIMGSGGNNFIDGKAGNDTLTGGSGTDQFVLTTALNASTNVDTITDFNAADDFLRLDDAIFTQIATGFLTVDAFAVGNAATSADHRIVYNAATGDVFYDRDGVGGVAQVKFANIDIGAGLTEADIFIF